MREGMRERDRNGGPDASGAPPFRGPAYKTKLCALWRGRGGCPRPNCGFAHGEAELRRPPPRASFQPRPRPEKLGIVAGHILILLPSKIAYLLVRFVGINCFQRMTVLYHAGLFFSWQSVIYDHSNAYPVSEELNMEGRRDYRDHEFRVRPERRHSPRGRYSPERDNRGRSVRDKKPSSEDRESSRSRSPIRKSVRKHSKSSDSGKTNSSESLRTSYNEDREKDERHIISDEKNGCEAEVKQMHLDMEALREDKSKLEMILEKKTDEERKLSSRVEDLELQLNKEKEDYQRMTSKKKKLIRAHGRYIKAKEDLKRSQARFERLADLLASDILKPTKEQGSTGIAGNEDPYNANEMSPSDQRQNHVSAWRKRPIALSASEEAKTGKRQRDNDDDMIPSSENYRPEDALEHVQDSKGADIPKSFTTKKKLGEADYDEDGNIVSSNNIFADRYKGDDEEVDVD